MAKIKCPECKDGIVGYAQQEHSSAVNPIYCSNCGGTGWLDNLVYQYPVSLQTEPLFIVQKLDLEDTYICQRLYWRTMTKPVTASEAKSIYNGLPDDEFDLHRIIPTGGDE